MPQSKLSVLHQSYLQNYFPFFRLPPLASPVLPVPTFTAQIWASWGKELIWYDKWGQLLLPVYVTILQIQSDYPITSAGMGFGGGLFETHLVFTSLRWNSYVRPKRHYLPIPQGRHFFLHLLSFSVHLFT